MSKSVQAARLVALLTAVMLGATGCAELENLRHRVEVQESEIEQLTAQRNKWEKSFYDNKEIQTAEIEQLRHRQEMQDRELDRARNIKSDRERELEDLLRRHSLNADAREVEAEALAEVQTRKIKDLEELRVSLERSRTDLQANVKALETQNEAGAKRAADLAAEDIEQEKLITELETSLTALGKERRANVEQREALVEELDSVRGEIETGAEQLDRARTQIAELSSGAGDAADLTAKLAEAEARGAKLGEANKALTADADELRARVAALQSEAAQTAQDAEARVAEAASTPETPAIDPILEAAAEKIRASLAELDSGGEITVIVDERGLRAIIPNDLAFGRGSVILADTVKPLLDAVAGGIRNLIEDRRLRIEGHTDNQPMIDLPFVDNWALGAARADHVRRFLMDNSGLDAKRIEAVSRAFSDPLAGNDTRAGRAKNRRVEIVVENLKP